MKYIDSLKDNARGMILLCQKNRALLATIIQSKMFPYEIRDDNGDILNIDDVVEAASAYLVDVVKPFLIEHPLDTVYDFMSEADFEQALERAQTINTTLETLVERLCNKPNVDPMKEWEAQWFPPAGLNRSVMRKYGQATQNNNYYVRVPVSPPPTPSLPNIGPLKISKRTVKAKTGKLKATWTVDAEADLKSMHNGSIFRNSSPLILPNDI